MRLGAPDADDATIRRALEEPIGADAWVNGLKGRMEL